MEPLLALKFIAMLLNSTMRGDCLGCHCHHASGYTLILSEIHRQEKFNFSRDYWHKSAGALAACHSIVERLSLSHTLPKGSGT